MKKTTAAAALKPSTPDGGSSLVRVFTPVKAPHLGQIRALVSICLLQVLHLVSSMRPSPT
ncbi:hypothetical protein [Methylobacterium sp. CM6257]